MEEKGCFSYTYSAGVKKEVLEIRSRYLPKEESKIDELRRLDRKVQNSGVIEALCVGVTGFLLFGLGVCMSVKVIGESVILGVILGLIGSLGLIFAYPIYRTALARTRKKLVPRIIELSTELSGNSN